MLPENQNHKFHEHGYMRWDIHVISYAEVHKVFYVKKEEGAEDNF